MAKLNWKWNGALPAAGDDAPEQARRNWLPPLPPPPREVFKIMGEAEDSGLWLRWCRDPVALRRFNGMRYRLSKAHCETPLFMSNDLSEIRAYIDHFET